MKKIITLCLAILALGLSPIKVSAQATQEITNLVIFVRFADDSEITHSFAQIDTMFNGRKENYLSIYNFYKVMSYDKIHYNTMYTNDIQNGQIISFQDSHPRGYYMPYSPTNPIGYEGELPTMGICMREAELLAAAIDYVDNNNLVDDNVVLDGNNDGMIDNISFVVKGNTGEWGSIIWPHMWFFPQDSIDHPVRINGVMPNTFNMEFEGSSTYFTANVFRHEMGHSLQLPDLYHYYDYTNISAAGNWDMMSYPYVSNQTSAIFKNKFLNVCDEPVEITEDGDYTLLSAGSSPTQNCYYIKSSIDPTQWFVFEYRNKADLFESGIPGTGLIAARWNDTVPIGTPEGFFANALFNGDDIANLYWIFRPGSSSDTQNGNLSQAHFSQKVGRTAFGPNTNPHPYLTDGTPETSFEITDINDFGDYLTFHVHFLNAGVDDKMFAKNLMVSPNPATDRLHISGEGMRRVEMFNSLGQLVLSTVVDDESYSEIMISDMPSGLYILRVVMNNGDIGVKKVVKAN